MPAYASPMLGLVHYASQDSYLDNLKCRSSQLMLGQRTILTLDFEMTNDDNPGSAIGESKVNEITKNVESAADLLKLAKAKQIFDRFERREKIAFPWENVLKFSSVAIVAPVAAVILVTSGITDNFWDAYNFAKEAKTVRESELATMKDDLGATKTELERLQGQLSDAETAKEKAEADRLKAEGLEAKAIDQRDSALADVQAARTNLMHFDPAP